MKRNVPATEAAGFADARSYIRPTGEEVLYGKDWLARKLELWERCKGKCEFFSPHSALKCWKEAVHPHHLIKKSVKHDDRLKNLMAICEEHHRMMHPEKQPRFGEGRGESAETAK